MTEDMRPVQARGALLARVDAAHRATMRARTTLAQAREAEVRALALLKLAAPELWAEYMPAVQREPYLG